MVRFLPLLGVTNDTAHAAISVGLAMGDAAAVIGAVVVMARFVGPHVFDCVDASRSREVLLVAALGLCIGTAWLTSLAGLSLALGALLGGRGVADTECSASSSSRSACSSACAKASSSPRSSGRC
jgi:CPA2 family monovalent cation:H+ antiporter-2